MIFKCNNEDCDVDTIEVNVLKVKVVNGEVVHDTTCPKCKENMEDVTPHEGFGHIKKPMGDRGKAYYSNKKR